jgi:monoamine oxidase
VTDRGDVHARAVIVTASTSVLANRVIAFTPELPASMQEAFVCVPLGSDNKVFFRVAPGRMPFEGTEYFAGRFDSLRTASYATRPAGQEVLTGFFGGRLARELEEQGELENFAREELVRIFGADFAKDLQAAVSTAWCSDPWSSGAYSAALPGRAHMRETLQQPIAERIFFAGEACSVGYFGTIIGAWHSGVSAAEQALDALGR